MGTALQERALLETCQVLLWLIVEPSIAHERVESHHPKSVVSDKKTTTPEGW